MAPNDPSAAAANYKESAEDGDSPEVNTSLNDNSDQSLGSLYTSVLPPGNLPDQLEPTAQQWLAWQCEMIAGLYSGAVYLPASFAHHPEGTPLAVWPADSGLSNHSSLVRDVLQQKSAQALLRQKTSHSDSDSSQALPDKGRLLDHLAVPVFDSAREEILFVVVVTVATRPSAQRQAMERLLNWGGLWLRRSLGESVSRTNTGHLALESLLDKLLSSHSAKDSAETLADSLASAFHCSRVSLAFYQQPVSSVTESSGLQVEAISHTREYDQSTTFIADLQATMLEALQQNTVIVYPANDIRTSSTGNETNRYLHQNWSSKNANAALCTVPLLVQRNGRQTVVGALMLERQQGKSFSTEELDTIAGYSRLLGAIVHERLLAEESLWSLAKRRMGNTLLSASGHSKTALFISAGLLTIVVTAFLPGSYHVKAAATLQASEKKTLVAPFDGYVLSSSFRAGDLVEKGQIIAQFDNRTLLVELEQAQSDIDRRQQDYQEALAAHNKADVAIHRAALQQLKARKSLIDQHLAQSNIRAPFAGVVVSGDLTQAIGSPMSLGDKLFEVAPADSYRLKLEIDEYDLAHVQQGSTGELRLTSIPDQVFSIRLNQVLPLAVAEGGKNYFPTHAELTIHSNQFRPGMSGIVKIDVGEKPLLWIWTHSLIDRLKLWFWSVSW